MGKASYIIRGGVAGRERLRVVARVLRPTSLELLRRAGIRPGQSCLDVGCGGGDFACDLARMVGPAGRVVGTDIDETKIAIARREAEEQKLCNLEYRFEDVTRSDPKAEFDLIHARFVLTHLTDPALALAKMRGMLRPGGVLVVEDIDYRACFCEPENQAFQRHVELYTEAAKRRGANANIGARLPALLIAAKFEEVRMNVVQAAGMEGEVKLLAPLTMENIADTVVAEGLATPDEVTRLVGELYEFARTPNTVMSSPRIVGAWGLRAPQD